MNPITFEQWKQLSIALRLRAEAYEKSVWERSWELAESHGIGRCGCSLHNASIDDDMRGWCKGNPARLKAAKKAVWMQQESWKASRLVDAIVSRAWARIVR